MTLKVTGKLGVAIKSQRKGRKNALSCQLAVDEVNARVYERNFNRDWNPTYNNEDFVPHEDNR